MQPGDNLIDPAGSNHGVLSHRAGEHLQNLIEGDRTPFDEAQEQTDISQDRMGPWERFGRGRTSGLGERGARLAAPGVEEAFLQSTGFIPVVGGAALDGLTPAVSFATTKGTPQIASTGITPVGEKEDAAVPASGQAPAQPRVNAQDRSQQHAIRHDQDGHGALPIPLGVEAKMLPDLDGKKPRFWLWMLKLVKHPLRYPKRLPAVEVAQGEFFWP